MAKNKGGSYTPPTRAEIEAMRAEKMQLVPNGEAGRRERKLLEHYGAAQADLQWIVDNNAWHELGFDTFTGWYTARVKPAVAAAGLRPTQGFALYVLENVQSDEAKLPKQQRLLQRELADLVGVSVSTLRRLSQDPPQTSNGAGADLEDADEPDPADIPDALTQAIRETAAHTSGAVPPATTDSASPVVGEPDDSDQAVESSGTQTAVDDALGIRATSSTDGGELLRDGEDPPAPDGGVEEALPSGVTPQRLSEDNAAFEAAIQRGLDGLAQDSPAADSLPPQAHAGVPAVGDQIEERDEEEAAGEQAASDFRPIEGETVAGLHRRWLDAGLPAHTWQEWLDRWEATYSPAAATTSLPDGNGNPNPEQSQQPGQDSPTGIEGSRSETNTPAGRDRDAAGADLLSDAPEASAIATTGQSGIDHHDGAGVSPRGEAPEDPRPSVAPVELEDGERTSPDSSSSSDTDDPDDDEQTSTDLLLMTFGALIRLIDHMDVEAVAPTLFPAELEQLHQHVEAVSGFVAKVSRVRFELLARTP